VRTIARKRQADPAAPHVVICGAGFGGLSAVRGLTRAGLRVTLIDGHLYSTFQPLLYQVATAGLNPGDVAYPAGGFVRRYGAVFRRGELATIDPASRQIKLADGRDFGYDYLILATGITTAFFGVEGAAENTFGLYTRTDAIALRDHLMAGFERLSEQDGDLHVTVVGGGATGVELAGTLAELRRTVLASTFPDVDPARVHVQLVEMAPYLLGPFHEKLRDYAKAQLLARGVDVRLDTRIGEVTADHVKLVHGEDLPSDITVWAAGVAAGPGVAAWGLPQGKGGRVMVGPDLRVQGQDRIFAVGDIAVNPDDPTPQLAQPAIQMGRHAAAQIARLENGTATEPFKYHDKGTMATIGRRSAVVQLAGGLRMRGTLAWLAWFALHLLYLLGGRNRVSTVVNLTYRYISWGHGGAVIVGDEPVNAQQQPVASKNLFLHIVVVRWAEAICPQYAGRAMNRYRARTALSAMTLLGVLGGATALAGCSSGQLSPSSGSSQSAGSNTAAMDNPNLDLGSSLGNKPAPDFRLHNQFGQPMSLSQFRGKVVMLAFEDSECTNVCPLTTQSMLEAKQLLGPAGSQVQLLGVDANPDAITTGDVLSYSRTHGLVNQWDFLTGSLADLKATWTKYDIAVQIESDQIDHTPALFVIDQQGREHKLYLTQMAYSSVGQSAQVLADEIATLLPGHPKVASQQSLASVTVQGPADRVTLPAAETGGAPVALGAGQPHLVMFFATWLSEVSDLKSELTGANGYVAAARREGLAPLVAVDEMVVEPSAATIRSYLGGLGAKLDYPVGLDTAGRLADGYQVQDQPWLALVSASGKILWSHDGWLPWTSVEATVKQHLATGK
jgi:NADH dehydrogenase